MVAFWVLGIATAQRGAISAVYAQAASSSPTQRPATQPSALRGARAPAAADLYHKLCIKCHGADGTGSAARGIMPEIPNFTDRSWQKKRTDHQLRVSILDGKGNGMPPGRDKITAEQVRTLVAYVRAFASKGEKAAPKEQKEADQDDFEVRFRRLEAQMEDLRQQLRALSEPSQAETPRPVKEPAPDGTAREGKEQSFQSGR